MGTYIKKEVWLDETRWRWRAVQGGHVVSFSVAADVWEDRFSVRDSQLAAAGRGLYAARDYRKGETLTYYGGKDLGRVGDAGAERAREQAQTTDAGRYILDIKGRYVDGYNRNNPAHVANDAGAEHSNATCEGGGRMVAIKGIREGSEIFWTYGQAYWAYWGKRTPREKLTRTTGGAIRRTGGRRSDNGRVQVGPWISFDHKPKVF